MITTLFLFLFLWTSFSPRTENFDKTTNVLSLSRIKDNIEKKSKEIGAKIIEKSQVAYIMTNDLLQNTFSDKSEESSFAAPEQSTASEESSNTDELVLSSEDDLISRFLDGLVQLSPEKTIILKGEMEYGPNEFIHHIERETDGSYISAVFQNLEVKYETVTLFKKATLRTKVTLIAKYHHTPEQEALIDQWVDLKIIEWDLERKSDYEKVKTIHDNIIRNASYIDTVDPSEAKDSNIVTEYAGISVHSPYSIIANQKGVCQSYASLFQKFCDRLNLPSKYITGIATSQSQISDHAWNKVNIDGNWYNIDLTWDDPVVNFNGQIINKAQSGFENKKYFLKSDEFFLQDHQARNGLELVAPKNY